MIDTENEVEMDKWISRYAFTLHLPCIYLPLGLYQFIVMERIVIQDLLFDPPILTSRITKHGDILQFFFAHIRKHVLEPDNLGRCGCVQKWGSQTCHGHETNKSAS